MTVTSLTASEGSASGRTGAEMTAEGEIVDKDGEVLSAFSTRESANDGETPLQCCETDMDRIAWSIFRELGKPLQEAVR